MEEKRVWLARRLLVTAVLGILVMAGMKLIFRAGYVSSGSMEPTLAVGARIVGYRMDHEYRRGDIVMFSISDNGNKHYAKRILGMPGDIVSLTEDAVYTNGRRLEEPYLKEDMVNGEVGEYRVPAGSYFLMGDNRNESYDSRHWDNAYVLEENILCKVRFAFFSNSLYKGMD